MDGVDIATALLARLPFAVDCMHSPSSWSSRPPEHCRSISATAVVRGGDGRRRSANRPGTTTDHRRASTPLIRRSMAVNGRSDD